MPDLPDGQGRGIPADGSQRGIAPLIGLEQRMCNPARSLCALCGFVVGSLHGRPVRQSAHLVAHFTASVKAGARCIPWYDIRMMSRQPRATGSSRRHDLTVLLGYLALAAAFYAPILLGLRWFPTGDFTDHFLPFSLFQRAEILSGRLPVWNPYTFSGHPFLADVQAAVFYPISNLVLGLTLPWGEAMSRLYWLQVEAILQIALAGFFTYLLARDLVQDRAAAFLAGCLFAFSGYLTGYPPLQTAVLRTAIWLPLILWCLRRAFAGGTRWRWWVAAAGAYAIAFLGGHPQTFLFLSYCVAGWIVVLFATGAGIHHKATKDTKHTETVGEFAQLPVTGAGSRWAQLPKVAAFYGLFLGLSAAQLLPSLEFTSLSVRASVDYGFASGGFPLKDTWQMFAPGVVSQFSPLFVGIVGLGLAVLAAVSAIASFFQRKPASANGQASGFLLEDAADKGATAFLHIGCSGGAARQLWEP